MTVTLVMPFMELVYIGECDAETASTDTSDNIAPVVGETATLVMTIYVRNWFTSMRSGTVTLVIT